MQMQVERFVSSFYVLVSVQTVLLLKLKYDQNRVTVKGSNNVILLSLVRKVKEKEQLPLVIHKLVAISGHPSSLSGEGIRKGCLKDVSS